MLEISGFVFLLQKQKIPLKISKTEIIKRNVCKKNHVVIISVFDQNFLDIFLLFHNFSGKPYISESVSFTVKCLVQINFD